jgi:pimeloyl-ACP methyl ester carboxylesterase
MVSSLFYFYPGPTIGPVGGILDAIESIEKLEDLERFIARRESKVQTIKPGLSKGIVWADPVKKDKRPLSIVYLHGFSASRGEMYPVMDEVARDLGANLFYTRLTAHGLEDGEGFAAVTPQDWIDDAREALAIAKRLGDRVILVGMSTGAPLALHLAFENLSSDDIAAMVLISPNHYPADSRVVFASGPLGRFIARLSIGTHRVLNPMTKAEKAIWTPKYRSEGVTAMVNLVTYVYYLDLTKIKTPALTLYTHKDKIVNLELVKSRHEQLGSTFKRIVDMPEAKNHYFAGYATARRAVLPARRQIVAFLREALLLEGL